MLFRARALRVARPAASAKGVVGMCLLATPFASLQGVPHALRLRAGFFARKVMSSLSMSAIVFGCVFGGALLGLVLRRILPDHHLSAETKDVVRQRIVSELAVITGTTHGIGRVTSRELACAGKTVVMLCRDVTAAGAVRDEIRRHAPGATVEVVRCDLSSLAPVREAAAAVRRDYPPIGLLVNNAGMVSARRRTSAEGF